MILPSVTNDFELYCQTEKSIYFDKDHKIFVREYYAMEVVRSLDESKAELKLMWQEETLDLDNATNVTP